MCQVFLFTLHVLIHTSSCVLCVLNLQTSERWMINVVQGGCDFGWSPVLSVCHSMLNWSRLQLKQLLNIYRLFTYFSASFSVASFAFVFCGCVGTSRAVDMLSGAGWVVLAQSAYPLTCGTIYLRFLI